MTDACKLFTKDEASIVTHTTVTTIGDAAHNTLDVWIGPLTGCGYSAGGSTYMAAAIVANGADQYAKIKAGQPHPVTALPGIGDDAFTSDQGGSGKGPFLVGALKGTTAVYLFAIGDTTPATLDALQTLIATAVPRV